MDNKPINDRDEQMFDKGYAAGKASASAEIAALRSRLQRLADHTLELSAALAQMRSLQTLADEEVTVRTLRVHDTLEKLCEALKGA